MDKGRIFLSALILRGKLSNKDSGKILIFYASLKSLSDFHLSRITFGDGILESSHYLRSLFKFRHNVYPHPMHICKKERHIVAGCHESFCLLELLKFQLLLCRGVPLFEASFSCQCFVQDGEWAFGTAQWWGRVHLDSNDRLEFTSLASRFGRNLWIYYRCI